LNRTDQWIRSLLEQSPYRQAIAPESLRSLVHSYLGRAAKRLRPAAVLFCCGAVGGNEQDALPAAAAVELFHTWTLVHDDIIDHDERRRGGPTAHVEGAELAARTWGLPWEEALDYGRSLALLTGDVQHGWSASLLAASAAEGRVRPEIALALLQELEGPTLCGVVQGEALDMAFEKMPLEEVGREAILEMLYCKTGTLYQFAGRAGAMIGLGTTDRAHPTVQALATFTGRCGLAFQLQDDVLGITGDEARLGKPVGSDIREGKRTLIVYEAMQRADPEQKQFLARVLGKRGASKDELAAAAAIMARVGAVEATRQWAHEKVQEALPLLESVPPSEYRDLLVAWAHYAVERDL